MLGGVWGVGKIVGVGEGGVGINVGTGEGGVGIIIGVGDGGIGVRVEAVGDEGLEVEVDTSEQDNRLTMTAAPKIDTFDK